MQMTWRLFWRVAGRFRELDSVSGTEPGANGSGLGPRFNLDSCAGCHAYPAPGGSQPRERIHRLPWRLNSAPRITIPSFIQSNGPVRARAVRAAIADGTPDGGVHNLFVITGRADAPADAISQQPDFDAAVSQNIAFFLYSDPACLGPGWSKRFPMPRSWRTARQMARPKRRLGIQGQSEPECQRRHHHAVWLEGAEQIGC